MSEVETTMQHPIVSYLEIINIVDNERRALAIGLPDTHHQAYRQRYRTLNGTTVVTQGTYCGQTNHEGKLHLLLGFIDVESA